MINEETKKIIVEDYEKGLSLGDICEKYKIKSKSYIVKYILNGKTRTLSESLKLAHKKYPNSFKHTIETKRKMREKRLEWMKNNQEKTAWRLRNMSYPEKCFQKMLENNELDKKYLIYREYSVFPYFIDFAFIDLKVAVEIDGSQHLEENRRKKDNDKDALLMSKGWRILRIPASEILYDNTNVLNYLLKFIGDNNVVYNQVGILKAPKSYKKVSRSEDGLSDKQRANFLNQRKVERPSKEVLFTLIKNLPFTKISKKYEVSDKTITKWCKYYGLPYRKKDIKLYNL